MSNMDRRDFLKSNAGKTVGLALMGIGTKSMAAKDADPGTVRIGIIGLYSHIKRRFIVTTDSNHTLKIAENLLNREFTARKPNQKWAADITYIPTKMGCLYLAVVMDLFSRRIVGWSMSGSKAKYMRVLRMAKKIFSITLRCSIIVNVGIKHWAM